MFSKEAYEFVDRLEEAGQSYWQILPLGPTGYGDSPYQSFSTFAGNPYFIDLETLVKEGLLTEEECDACDFGDNAEYIDYEKIYLSRFKVLRKAFERFAADDVYDAFVSENGYWLEDYALYMAIKDALGGISWSEWPAELKDREEAALNQKREELAEEVAFYKFQQFMFLKQWKALKAYANERVSVSSVIFRFMLHLTVPIPGQIRFCSSLMRTTSQKQLPDARRMRSPQPDSSGATRYTDGTIIRAQVMHGGCYVWLTCLNCTILSASTISADLMNIIPSRSVIRRQSAATGKKDRAWICSTPSKKSSAMWMSSQKTWDILPRA